MKKFLALFLAIVMSLALFSGCKEKDEGKITAGAYNPPITITYTNPLTDATLSDLQATDQTQDDNVWTRAYKDQLGIKLEMDESLSVLASYQEKLTAQIAADMLPDLVLMGSGDYAYSNIKKLYDNGAIADLTNSYETYASADFKAIIDAAGKEALMPATFNGKLYSIPQIIGYENEAYSFYHIRKDWLDAIGKDVPKTFEELLEVAKLFTTSDPDGNNKDDTYGISFGGDFRDTASLIFNAYGAYPNQWLEKDGKLVNGSTLPEMKAALSKLAELYTSGYINPKFSETTWDLLYYEFNQGKAGIYMGKVYYGLLLNDGFRNNPDMEVVPVYAMTAKDGDTIKLQSPNSAANYYVMNKSCKNPEAIIKMFNLYVSISKSTDADTYQKYIYDSNSRQLWNASPIKTEMPGENYRKASKLVEALKTNDNSKLFANELAVYTNVKDYLDNGTAKQWGWNFIYGENGTEFLMGKYLTDKTFVFNKFNAAPTDSMQLYKADLMALELGGFSEIIMGTQQPDYFDTIVSNWYQTGGQDITNEVNAWYDTVK